jgi:predicted O-methyltransferase YrrM
MNDFKISRAAFSEFFWQQVGMGRSLPYGLGVELEELREQADYNTGSLSDEDVYDLSALVRYFEPTVVCEIGTFIGRSTHTIADNMKAGVIWTCDGSNALDLPAPENKNVTIRQFKKTSSTEMFAKAMTERQKFDLFYIDGRLSQRDIELMAECVDFTRAVIVLDDFEGVEKGVANASMLLSSVAADFTLIYPKPGRKTAVLLPFTRIRFVPQA